MLATSPFQSPPQQKALLSEWPMTRPGDWLDWVDRPFTPRELDRVQTSIRRDRPLGTESWTKKYVAALGLESTVRSPARPRKEAAK